MDQRTPLRATRLTPAWLLGSLMALIVVSVVSLGIGPVDIAPHRVAGAVLSELPGVNIDHGLDPVQHTIVTTVRLPRVVLGLLVGAMLAISGAAYQGSFRNPLADPYLLGVAAGAGLGATLAIVNDWGSAVGFIDPVPLAAFLGALLAVAVAFSVGSIGSRSSVTLILAGVAVASFFTAAQTYVLQRNIDVVQEVYSWILGRVSTSGWGEVKLLLPYAIATIVVLLRFGRALDVMAVGDDEARSLGVDPVRVRLVVVTLASLAAAATVAVAGLIGFVGLVVAHAVRLTAGSSNRIVLPLSAIFGATFMVLADLLARNVIAPAELPVGVVTAFVGAPFFAVILRTTRRTLW
ncbi:MAG: iron ABC transporter permease [Actinomycetia bacterium]|nr:iron ABC transporter permease [Actinomycetes bacterium]MCP4961036.1 iron ABC transporter permease [Actinomycetes bacterium]